MIKGHSGCSINIKDGLLVKSTKDTDYPKDRLVAQIEKQKLFYEIISDKQLLVPRVVKEDFSGGYSVYMQYFRCSNIVQYLHRAGKSDLDALAKSLCDLVDFCINKCALVTVDKHLLINKFRSIQTPSGMTEKFESYLDDEITIPIGICHGDLTLSNVLIKPESNNFVIIDFLDSFIESPIVDIAKIRQDTKHGWSSFIYPEQHDKIKTTLSLEYLDNKFVEHFKKYEFYKHYELFQFMNLVRILPYSKQTKTSNFLMEQICSL